MKARKNEVNSVSRKKCESANRMVLVGTYKGDQLTKWRDWYNYPISDDDKMVLKRRDKYADHRTNQNC